MRPGCRAGWWVRAEVAVTASGAVAACVIAIACAGATVPKQPPMDRLTQRASPLRWEHLAAARAWPKAAEPFAARGHAAGEYLIEVHVAPAFLAEYRALTSGSRLPVGTLIAAFHRNRVTGEAGTVYAMSKRADGEWEYVVAAQDGAIDARGALPLCARCHADAPADSVFGVHAAPAAQPAELPQPTPRSPSN